MDSRPRSISRISRKFTLLILAVASATAFLMGAVILQYEQVRRRAELTRDNTVLAGFVAANLAPTMVADDPAEATRVLLALRAHPEVVRAAVYRANGQLFTDRYVSTQGPLPAPQPLQGTPDREFRMDRGFLLLTEPIISGNERLGTLRLRLDLGSYESRFWDYGMIVGLSVLTSVLVALLVGARLQRFISEPLLELGRTIREVSRKQDYSLRVNKTSHDEIGELADSFNEMLEQIRQRKEALRASEERFRQLAGAVDQVFWMADLETEKIIYVSPAFERIWGIPMTQLEQNPKVWLDYVHPADKAIVQAAFRQQRETGSSEEEYRIVRPDGQERWIRNRAFPVRDADGRLRRLVGINEDITAEKAAETALRASEERYRLLADNADDFVVLNDTAGNRLYVSPSYYRVTGWLPEDLRTTDWRTRLHPDDLPVIEKARAANFAGQATTIEHRILCRNGSWIWVELHCRPVLGPDGQVQQLLQWSRNIDERKRLDRERLKFFALVEGSSDFIAMADLDGRVIYVNQAGLKLVGLANPADIQGLSIRDFHTEESFRRAEAVEIPAVRNSGHWQGENQLRHFRTGEAIDVEINSFLVRDPKTGEPLALATVQRDMTRRKEAERQLRASEERLDYALRGASDGLWDWDLRSNEVFYSPRWKEMLGYADAEVPSHLSAWEQLVDPADRERTLRLASEAIAGRAPKFEVEFRMRHKDGHWVDILSRATLVRDDAGRAVRLVGTHVDITERKRAESALRESEARYRLLADNTVDIVTLTDLDGTRLYTSPSFSRLTGWTEEEAKPADWRSRVHPDDLVTVECSLAAARSGQIATAEYRTLCRDGSWLWTELIRKPVLGPDGKVEKLLSCARIIDARKRAEEKLRHSEMQFRQMAEVIRQVFWLSDPSKNQVLYVSPGYERIWGRSVQSLYEHPRTWVEAIHPEDRERIWAAAREKQVVGEYDEEYRVLRPDGSIVWVRDRAFPIRDEKGTLIRLCGAAEDITARKRAQTALQESEEQFRTLTQFAPAGIFLTDPSGQCVFVNARWTEITGLSFEKALGPGWSQALHPEDRQRVFDAWNESVRLGKEFSASYRFLRPDGGERWVEGVAAAIRGVNGEIKRYVGMVIDITERRELERQILEVSDREQAMLGEQLHNTLCQQLVSAGFAADFLARQLEESGHTLTGEARRLLQQLQDSVSQAYGLVGGLFPTRLNEEGLVAALEELAHHLGQQYGVSYVVEHDTTVDLSEDQAMHLFRVAQEAMTNAGKHARARQVRVSLFEQAGNTTLTVVDDGCGIPVAAASAKGFGMNFMRYRASLIGARLTLEPAGGGGTVLTCVLPRVS